MFKKIKKFLNKGKTKKQLQRVITDYKRLIKLYSEILTLVQKNDLTNSQEKLQKFFRAYKHANSIETDDKVLQNKIDKIDKVINLYSQKYAELREENKEEFLEEFTNIGNLLLEKLKLEKQKEYEI